MPTTVKKQSLKSAKKSARIAKRSADVNAVTVSGVVRKRRIQLRFKSLTPSEKRNIRNNAYEYLHF
jgi:hypothetical protein